MRSNATDAIAGAITTARSGKCDPQRLDRPCGDVGIAKLGAIRASVIARWPRLLDEVAGRRRAIETRWRPSRRRVNVREADEKPPVITGRSA
jgi:hypothetical protein